MSAAGDARARETFWNWSLAVYGREGVEPRLLALQDGAGLDVNLALWCGWCADGHDDIPELVLRKAIDVTRLWSRDVTGALRTARRALKTPPRQADAAAAAALRETIKQAELGAERVEQSMLETLARDALSPSKASGGAQARARRNLSGYAALAGAARRDGFSALLLDELAVRMHPGDED